MPRRNRNAGMVRQIAAGDPHADLRRLLVSIASKADTRAGAGRAARGAEGEDSLSGSPRNPVRPPSLAPLTARLA
jgi:hypothetical protein